MALYVINKSEGEKVPFLRGILTRSLVKAGLSFDDAYQVADHTREKLSNKGEVTTDDLKEMVSSRLEKLGFDDALERYELRGQDFTLTVLGRDEVATPFSRSEVEQSLEICSLAHERVLAIVASIEQQLRDLCRPVISSSSIARLVYEHLKRHEDKTAARRYLLWREFSRSGRPLVILIGGTTGSGKSTISADLSHRLNIVRTQSTDMLREVMRIMMPKRLLPSLHESSFSAYKVLPISESSTDDTPALQIGYLTQASRVGVAISAVLNRAITEGVSVIIEGIHMHPQLMKELAEETDAIVVPVIIAIPKRKSLRKQLKGRGQQISSRRSQRYMDNFDAIWGLQSFLLESAEENDVAIVPNSELDDATALVKEYIAEVLATHFKGSPELIEDDFLQKAEVD